MGTGDDSVWSDNLSKNDVKELLSKWRDENSRNPEKVRDLWRRFQMDSSLGDEKWPALEQVFLAAIDLQDTALIKECVAQLDSQFPGSHRVRRLKTMARLESRERYDDALKTYDELIKSDESNSIFYKRKIAILIAQRKLPEAVSELCEYLEKFMNDQEAWLELADLYIQEQEYSKAAFCYEELILNNPHNHLYHEKFAEIQYTINNADSLELARSYFSQALKLCPTNLRALYGLYLTATNLATSLKASAPKKKENQKIASWALTQINEVYSEKGKEDLVASLESLMAGIQLS
ncbi:ER membrane protein complex subunit 2 [Halotydeus destructor]|nr:ER membrane protein complex subunit 2 [Halotydeus destructor]